MNKLQTPEACCERCIHDSGKYKVPCKRLMEYFAERGSLAGFKYCMEVQGQQVVRRYFAWDGSGK